MALEKYRFVYYSGGERVGPRNPEGKVLHCSDFIYYGPEEEMIPGRPFEYDERLDYIIETAEELKNLKSIERHKTMLKWE